MWQGPDYGKILLHLFCSSGASKKKKKKKKKKKFKIVIGFYLRALSISNFKYPPDEEMYTFKTLYYSNHFIHNTKRTT